MVRLPFIPRRIMNQNRDEDTTDYSKNFSENEKFYPTIWDVLKVKYLLIGKGFPVELVDQIVDEAEYWPSIEHRMQKAPKTILQDRDAVLLKTVPLCYDRKSLERTSTRGVESDSDQSIGPPSTLHVYSDSDQSLELGPSNPKILPHRGAHPCRKIMFQICSHDQGGRAGPTEEQYISTWTWFDIEVIHDAHKLNMYVDGVEQEILDDERGGKKRSFGPEDPLLLPRSNRVQVNPKKVGETQNHCVIWRATDNVDSNSPRALNYERMTGQGRATLDGKTVRDLDIGDSIALWARARFPGWSNHVHWASVRVFWAV